MSRTVKPRRQRNSDHSEIEQALNDLENVSATDADFNTVTRRLMDDVLEHVRDEENTLLRAVEAAQTR